MNGLPEPAATEFLITEFIPDSVASSDGTATGDRAVTCVVAATVTGEPETNTSFTLPDLPAASPMPPG